jgi:5-methylcytosine-specific restriction enzyme A
MPAKRKNPQLSPPRSWYELERWRRIRRAQLRAEPLCRMCLERDGRVVVATIVDHIEPHRGDWNKFLTGSLQSLCAHCHASDKHLLDLGKPRHAVGLDGWRIEK